MSRFCECKSLMIEDSCTNKKCENHKRTIIEATKNEYDNSQTETKCNRNKNSQEKSNCGNCERFTDEDILGFGICDIRQLETYCANHACKKYQKR
jgi:hypothetical protein